MKCPPTEFRELFKPGDYIRGWSTGKTVKITAIGEERFLYRDVGHSGRRAEYVRGITATWLWEKVEQP